MTIGVLALQGDVSEHLGALAELGAPARPVRSRRDLDGIWGIVLPGGESTTLSLLIDTAGLFEPLASSLADGMPALGTCAGLVLLAREVRGGRPDQHGFGVLDCAIRRNGFGRQADSFAGHVEVVDALRGTGHPQMEALFIRAPLIEEVGPAVEVLAWVQRAERWPAVLRQGNILASCFHPELTSDRRLHHLFVQMTEASFEHRREEPTMTAQLS